MASSKNSPILNHPIQLKHIVLVAAALIAYILVSDHLQIAADHHMLSRVVDFISSAH